jgi:hypothetical protein
MTVDGGRIDVSDGFVPHRLRDLGRPRPRQGRLGGRSDAQGTLCWCDYRRCSSTPRAGTAGTRQVRASRAVGRAFGRGRAGCVAALQVNEIGLDRSGEVHDAPVCLLNDHRLHKAHRPRPAQGMNRGGGYLPLPPSPEPSGSPVLNLFRRHHRPARAVRFTALADSPPSSTDWPIPAAFAPPSTPSGLRPHPPLRGFAGRSPTVAWTTRRHR